MKAPLFSILIPVYNVREYLAECLESVVNQTFSDFEVIVIDDGSTDGSDRICDQYAADYENIYVYHQENKGLMMSRKEGILKAKGEYCLFLDSDDYYALTLLEEVEKKLSQEMVDLLIYNKARVYLKRVAEKEFPKMDARQYRIVDKKEALQIFMGSNQYNSIVMKVVRRKKILPYLEEIYIPVNYAEDVLQSAWFLLLSDKIGFYNKSLYYYRIRGSSMIHKKTKEGMLEIVEVKRKTLVLLKESGYVEKESETAFLGILLNDILEGIYRLNHQKITVQERKNSMQALLDDIFIFDLLQTEYLKRLNLYNRFRGKLFKQRYFGTLIVIDYILLYIQQIQERLEGRKGFA